MDSRYRTWKLRNSTEIWRPSKHPFNPAKGSGGRGKLSASDSECNFSALMRDNGTCSQAKWDSSTERAAFPQDSNLSAGKRSGSRSSSPILRCRPISPDVCRTFPPETLNSLESGPLGTVREIISADRAGVTEHVVPTSRNPACSGGLPNSSRATAVGDIPVAVKPANKVDSHQLIRRSPTLSPTILTAQEEVISRPASVSLQMWQEKLPISRSRTDRSVIACKRWHSPPQGALAVGTTTPKRKDEEAKNRRFPQSLDVLFVPGVQLPSLTRLQRNVVGIRGSSILVDQMILPLCENLEGIQSDLTLCRIGAVPPANTSPKENSCCADDQTAGNSQETMMVSSLSSPDQGVLMRINMAFEPVVKQPPRKSDRLKENKMEGRCSSAVPTRNPRKRIVSCQIPGDVTPPRSGDQEWVPLKLNKEEWSERFSNDVKSTRLLSHLGPHEVVESGSVDREGRQVENLTEVSCEHQSGHNLSSHCAVAGRNAHLTDPPLSPRRRRWPKVLAPRAITSKISDLGRLSTTGTVSSSDFPSEEISAKPEVSSEDDSLCGNSERFLQRAAQTIETKKEERFQPNLSDSDASLKDINVRVKNAPSLSEEAVRNIDTSGNRSSLAGAQKSGIKSTKGLTQLKAGRELGKAAVRNPGNTSDMMSLALSLKEDSKLDNEVHHLKSKRGPDRTAVYKSEKRAGKSSECHAIESSKASALEETSIVADVAACSESKNKEVEAGEAKTSPSSAITRRAKTNITGPADAFREIRIDPTSRAHHLAGVTSAGQREACDLSQACDSVQHLHSTQAVTQRRASSCTLQVSGVVQEENIDCTSLQDSPRLADCSGQPTGIESVSQRLEEDQATQSSTSRVFSHTQPPLESNRTTRTEPNRWSNPLHQEDEHYIDRASLSSEKFSSILSYLGQVEESNLHDNFKLLQKQEGSSLSLKGSHSPRTVLEHEDSMSLANSTFTSSLTNMSNQSGDGEGGHSQTTSLFEGVRKKMQEYKIRISAQQSQNGELLRDLERLKTDKEQALSLERDRFGRELEVRAAEYKAAVQHHLSLNEKMVKDKETLSEKCCNLAGILSSVELKFEDKVNSLKEQYAQDLKKQREIWIAGEKPRREAWKERKTKEIKELTIKGLEPHIEGINEKHKQEMKKMETRFADEGQKKLELQAIQHRQDTCDLRNRLLKERDDILEKERMAALTRINDVAEKYEHQIMQLRMRVSSDVAAELEKLEEIRRKDKQNAYEMLLKVREDANERQEALRRNVETAKEEAISKKDVEIRALRSEFEKLKNDWHTGFDEKIRQEMQIQEKELKERCVKERDEQIEMIIERMENEKDEAIAQHQQELLVKIENLMEQKLEFMKKLKEVESKCASLYKMSLEVKEKAEADLANKDIQATSLEREMLSQSDLIEQLKSQINQEKKKLKEQENHYERRLEKEHDLLQSAQLDVERCNAEAQQMRLRKTKELDEVEIHVRQAIGNKDQVISDLREQLLAAREQIRHTELLLQQEHISFSTDPD